MSDTINLPTNEIIRKYIDRQSCIVAIRRAEFPPVFKAEVERFIERNTLKDCGRVPPNCLKAFMIKTAQKMGMSNLIPYAKKLFKSKVGYDGYYLDSGNLCRTN